MSTWETISSTTSPTKITSSLQCLSAERPRGTREYPLQQRTVYQVSNAFRLSIHEGPCGRKQSPVVFLPNLQCLSAPCPWGTDHLHCVWRRRGRVSNAFRHSVQERLADVFAWIFGIANLSPLPFGCLGSSRRTKMVCSRGTALRKQVPFGIQSNGDLRGLRQCDNEGKLARTIQSSTP